MRKALLSCLFFLFGAIAFAQYSVEVQVVNLQISVTNKQGDFIVDLKPEDFIVYEDGVEQTVLDLDLSRQPFSTGVLLDTSSSMESAWRIASRATEDFIGALRPGDEYFLMKFDHKVEILKDMAFVQKRAFHKVKSLRYGEQTRLFDGMIEALNHLEKAYYPRRALFVISDGINTRGGGSESKALELALRSKTIIYSLVLESAEYNFNPLKTLSTATGGTFFVMNEKFPRMQAAYEKIATDLSNRVTLYYKSQSDYSKKQKPEIRVEMKNPQWRARFQRKFYPQ